MEYKQNGRVIVSDGSGNLEINGTCPITSEKWSITVRESDWEAWKGGELAHKAFPYLSPKQREMLISGTSPKGWRQTFGEENEPPEVDHMGTTPNEYESDPQYGSGG